MKSAELQELTASEPLSLEEEFAMQKSWLEDENSSCTNYIAQQSTAILIFISFVDILLQNVRLSFWDPRLLHQPRMKLVCQRQPIKQILSTFILNSRFLFRIDDRGCEFVF